MCEGGNRLTSKSTSFSTFSVLSILPSPQKQPVTFKNTQMVGSYPTSTELEFLSMANAAEPYELEPKLGSAGVCGNTGNLGHDSTAHPSAV